MAKQVDRLAKFVEDNIDDRALPLHFDQVEKPRRESRVSCTLHRPDETFQQGAYPCQDEAHRQDELMTKVFDVWPCDAAEDFMLWQPKIHVPFFKFPRDKIYFYDLGQDSVLPFGDYDQQETGGYGSVRKATIHSSHHDGRRLSKASPIPTSSSPTYFLLKISLSTKWLTRFKDQQSDCFAIKKPHIPCLNDYLQEIEPFDKLGLGLGIEENDPDLNHLVPLQLTFKYGRDYYLVFPWADGNLKKFWREQTANPKDPAKVRWFMAQCSGITRGLRKLHHLSTQLSQKSANINSVNAVNGTEIILGGKEWGRHGDIKPENILWFENYKGEQDFLVISDFGLTQFNSAHSRSKVHQDQILGFSGTYRPPDLHLEDQPISQNYDIWSLGCVFLEFISWFLLGYEEAVDVFAGARLRDGTKGDVSEDTFFTFERDEKDPHDTSKKATLKKSFRILMNVGSVVLSRLSSVV
ncbi:hypothetical protein N0V84_000608 [Fusarium piperis]|uniref:Protein kinase domain-containing protein n=1 Tax=Fusarium piperis TaxID=1435070 RepID=A0A9W9BUY6_9HYPO|nr:hypothetical protein N0V84_000608 [Fusarium piperis]